MIHDVFETLKKLPEQCWTVLPSDPCQVIVIRRGMMGYIPHITCNNERIAREIAARHNARLGVEWEQKEAMEVGSCFGWEVPGADVDVIRAACYR